RTVGLRPVTGRDRAPDSDRDRGRGGRQSAGAPTLTEVALAAGVSRSTASRVFTDTGRVSDEARRAVERAARRLGYEPNRAARSLATGRSDSVALVIPESTTRLFGDP